MYKEAIYEDTRKVMRKVWPMANSFDFYLGGGTGLALQIGHRRSVDLDFFVGNFPERDILLSRLRDFEPEVTQEAAGTLDLLIDEVKVSFLEYDYPLLEPLVTASEFSDLRVAHPLDIGCMKLTAISSRGTKKDFFDLYFLLQKYSWDELWEAFQQKYEGVDYNKQHIFKSLIYFHDAEDNPNPDLLKEVTWEGVKSLLENIVLNF